VATESVVVATRSIRAGTLLSAADLAVRGVQTPPAKAYRTVQDAVGKMAMTDIQPGTPIQPNQLLTDTLAALLRPGERAVAVLIDEVIGVGGFVKPGDRVDVLAYVPANPQSRTQAFAQVAVRDARVLAYADSTLLDTEQDRARASSGSDSNAKSSVKSGQELKDLRATLHSAVLAIREAEVSKLMLTASTGSLRLALRPPAPDSLGVTEPSAHVGAHVVTEASQQTITAVELAPTARESANEPTQARSGVIIQEGSKEHPLTAFQ
jgi:pilus assembly protein CpaB